MLRKSHESLNALELLKEYLSYNADTGIFKWQKSPGAKCPVGSIAGSDSHGYVMLSLRGMRFSAHRVAWAFTHSVWPKYEIDHIDGDPGNNKIVNLRDVTSAQNSQNRKGRNINNTSGVTGVAWHKNREEWLARICIDGTTYNLGWFKTKEAAVKARFNMEEAVDVNISL